MLRLDDRCVDTLRAPWPPHLQAESSRKRSSLAMGSDEDEDPILELPAKLRRTGSNLGTAGTTNRQFDTSNNVASIIDSKCECEAPPTHMSDVIVPMASHCSNVPPSLETQYELMNNAPTSASEVMTTLNRTETRSSKNSSTGDFTATEECTEITIDMKQQSPMVPFTNTSKLLPIGTPPHPNTCPPDMDPEAFAKAMIKAYLGYTPKICGASSLPQSFFKPITEENIASYDIDVVAAVRENDLDAVKNMFMEGRSLLCCNRFGESLLHMACRRGYVPITRLILINAEGSVRITDDCGRTPLHDACWSQKCQKTIVEMILERDPCLLFVGDKRGHTPFAYARKEHWSIWRELLHKNCSTIVEGMNCEEVMKVFGNGDDIKKFDGNH